MPQIFRKSKININMTLRCISSGVPLRVMDILAAGGFLITTYQEEIAEYFEDEKDLVIVNSPEEMLEKTDYYLKNDTDRIKIAISGQHKVFNNYSYCKILPEIMKINRI
jgi:spore maturation protein CgeB